MASIGLSLPSLSSVLGLPPLSLTGGAGGDAGPAVSGNSSPVSFADGAFQVGGTGNTATNPITNDQTSVPTDTASATAGLPIFGAGGASPSASANTQQLLLYGGIACVAIFLLKKR